MSEVFYIIGDMLGYINNYIQFILLVFTILATLFYFMLPYIRPLKVLLGKIGISNREILRILWICYKNPRKHIRIYIELAILRSSGQHQNRSWWGIIRRDFKRFLDDNETGNDYTITVETPFDLSPTEFNDLVKAYFDYFKQNKTSERFAVPANEPVSFITNVEIDEGYIAPITFIMGLNDRYDEDWVKILRNYFTAFDNDFSPESAILPQELYFTYNWLMWGPSYQIKYDKDKHKLIQYGYGDESNSVNIILKNSGRSMDIWDKFSHEAEVSEHKKFGYNCSIKGKFYDTSEYYNYCADKLDNRSQPFLKRLASNYLGISFLLELIDFEIKTNLKAENYFFSAYLWIMFGLNDENQPGFTPRKSLTFFEHANLADIENYNFLANSLIEKCFKHFESIAAHPEYRKRKYHYCVSMNSFIEKLFKEKLTLAYDSPFGEWFKNNLTFNTPYAISEILDTFDNYFVSKEDDFDIIEVSAKNKDSIKSLCNYYADTYLDEFKTYRDSLKLDTMLSLLQNENKRFSFHINLAISKDGETLGSAVVFYFPEFNCGYIDSIAVHTNHRNYGIGKTLLNNSIQIMRQDTFAGKTQALNFIIAAIPSFCFDTKTQKKYRFWNNNGFKQTVFSIEEKQMIWSVLMLKDMSHNMLNNNDLERLIKAIEEIKKES
ncbi:MAG: GNAT family N-acetyltransferase [Bacteroidales bacterium]|nr:GNAT family N-acetyltransferase [Bacteroidales bacterium]